MNINADLTIPVCCYFQPDHLFQRTISYEISDIDKRKEEAKICEKCMKRTYLNTTWAYKVMEEIARRKSKVDIGN